MTDTELEVWQTVEALNRAWTTGRVDELERFFHEDIVAIIPTGRERLEGREACIAGWAEFVRQAKILDWKESDPRVCVFGDDAAVVTYYYNMLVEMGGKEMRLAGRDMFFMVKDEGRWAAVADQFSEYPVARSNDPTSTTS